MIIDISSIEFKKILDNERLYLPIRWNGDDFIFTLDKLYHLYLSQLEDIILEDIIKEKKKQSEWKYYYENVKGVCSLIIKSIKSYLNGFPSDAFETFKSVMEILNGYPLRLYRESVCEQLEFSKYNAPLKLFRIVGVVDNLQYSRRRVFHIPYNLRSKVTTSRYSIGGYPSLYLGTSIELCREELRLNPYDKFQIVSLFEIERNSGFSDTQISVIELSLKPQDFFEENEGNAQKRRRFNTTFLNDKEVRQAYLLWYPLIAACSYIRVNKTDPFAVEYIIPQLLMQWVRKELDIDKNGKYDKLIGIRYFSCASVKASDMGFNYVFPTSGKQDSQLPYDSVLMKAFRLTDPVFLHEYYNELECEEALKKMKLDLLKY